MKLVHLLKEQFPTQKLSKNKVLKQELFEITKWFNWYIESHLPWNNKEKQGMWIMNIRWYLYKNNILEIPKCKCWNCCSFALRYKDFLTNCGERKCIWKEISNEYSKKIFTIDEEYDRIKNMRKDNIARVIWKSKNKIELIDRLYREKYYDIIPSILLRDDKSKSEVMLRTANINNMLQWYDQEDEYTIRLRYLFWDIDINKFHLCHICWERYNRYAIWKWNFSVICDNMVCRSKYVSEVLMKNEWISNVTQRQEVRDSISNYFSDDFKRKLIEKWYNDIEYIWNDTNWKHKTFFCKKHKLETSMRHNGIVYRMENNLPICNHCLKDIYWEKFLKEENELKSFIESLWFKTYKKTFNIDGKRREIDIMIEWRDDIWFEYNWCMWHSNIYRKPIYHKDKKQFFLNMWLNVFNVWSNNWTDNKDVVKNMIRSKLWLLNSVDARNIYVDVIEKQNAIKFLNNNHIQWAKSIWDINIWLSSDNELLSVLSLKDNWNWRYEIKRYSSICNIVWWFEKIMSYIKTMYWSIIVETRLDCDYSNPNNNIYLKSWFKFIKWSDPWYFYINISKWHYLSRYSCFKKKLKNLFPKTYDDSKTEEQIMNENWYYRVSTSWSAFYIKYL